MKLLLDHCVDSRLAGRLAPHEVHTAAELGWEQLRNGELLVQAAAHGFDAVLTTDRNLKHQQNPRTLPVSVVVLLAVTNRLADLLPLVPMVANALERLEARQLIEVGSE